MFEPLTVPLNHGRQTLLRKGSGGHFLGGARESGILSRSYPGRFPHMMANMNVLEMFAMLDGAPDFTVTKAV